MSYHKGIEENLNAIGPSVGEKILRGVVPTTIRPSLVADKKESSKKEVSLTDEVQKISVSITDLKTQNIGLRKENERLGIGLRKSQEHLAKRNQELEDLLEQIDRLNREMGNLEYIRQETEQLREERDTLSKKINEFGKALAVSEQRIQETGTLLDKFRAERDDVSEEAATLNFQFSRAMKVIDEMRNALSGSKTREDALELSIEGLKEELKKSNDERDAYQTELNESQTAMENVRMSLLKTSREWRAIWSG